jgi:hypothetical protein
MVFVARARRDAGAQPFDGKPHIASIEAGSNAVQEAVMVVDVACPIRMQLQGAPVPSHCTRYMLPLAGHTSVTPQGMPAPEDGIGLI